MYFHLSGWSLKRCDTKQLTFWERFDNSVTHIYDSRLLFPAKPHNKFIGLRPSRPLVKEVAVIPRKVYLFSAVVLAALAILTLLRLSTSKAQVNSVHIGASQQETTPLPKSIIGAVGVMAFVIKDVLPGSAAEQAGLLPGDLVVVLDKQIESLQDFQGRILNSEPGTTFKIVFRRFNRSTGEWEEHKGTVQTRPFRASVSSQTSYVNVAGTRLDCPYGCCEFCTHVKCSECLVAGGWTGKRQCSSSDCSCFVYPCT
jgi:hypothetical protein